LRHGGARRPELGDEAANAALRRGPPREALAALRDALLPGGGVGRARRLPGGIAQGMHALDLIAPDGGRRRLVVRRYPAEKVRRRPDVAAREYRTLELLRDLGLPTARPVWLDADSAVFGTATLVTTRLPGRARELVRGLAAVWSAPRRMWRDPVPAPRALVHGDSWSGNTLWHRDRLVGVVDWDGCAIGYPGWDVGNCRVDLAMSIGSGAQDVFLGAYEDARGEALRNLAFWDLLAATAAAPDPVQWLPGLHDLGRTDLTPELMRSRLRAFIADGLARAHLDL
jgi:aminoglycoside phosphotransferase (APT) family kinase protein